MSPVIPIVNMNGTSKQALTDQYIDVLNALDKTLAAMRAAYPHGRDYQTVDQNTFAIACTEASQRFFVVKAIRDEFEEMAERLNQ